MMAALRVVESQPERQPIRCDCCGDEVIAEWAGDRLIIKQRRHGKTHTGVIVLTDPRLRVHAERDAP